MVIPNIVTKIPEFWSFWNFFDILNLSSAHACRLKSIKCVRILLLSDYLTQIPEALLRTKYDSVYLYLFWLRRRF